MRVGAGISIAARGGLSVSIGIAVGGPGVAVGGGGVMAAGWQLSQQNKQDEYQKTPMNAIFLSPLST